MADEGGWGERSNYRADEVSGNIFFEMGPQYEHSGDGERSAKVTRDVNETVL